MEVQKMFKRIIIIFISLFVIVYFVVIANIFINSLDGIQTQDFQSNTTEQEKVPAQANNGMEMRDRAAYLDWLQENRAYPKGFFRSISRDAHRSQKILVLAIDDNYPIIKNVSIFQGELVIIDEMRLDRITYGNNFFRFYSDNGSIELRNHHADNIFYGSGLWRESFDFIAKVDQMIPEEIFELSMDNQIQYAGNFEFYDFQIIHKSGNHNITEAFIESFNREISIVLEQDGFLAGENFPRNTNPRFKITEWNGKHIVWAIANGTLSGGEWRWYFEDRNTIHHRVSSFRHTDDSDFQLEYAYSASYIVRYKRR